MDLRQARRIVTEAEQPKAGLRRVAGGVFYWAPSSRDLVQPGMHVPKFSGRLWRGYAPHALLEEAFEEVRAEKYPDRPPRIGSVMLCPTPDGFCRKGRERAPQGVFMVAVKGLTFTTDAEMWTEAAINAGRILGYGQRKVDQLTPEQRERVLQEGRLWANDYWKGRLSYSGFNETLVRGVAVVAGRA